LSSLEGENIAKEQLSASYEIKDLGETKIILGMQVERDRKTGDIKLS